MISDILSNPFYASSIVLGGVALAHIIPWILDKHAYNKDQSIPGPFLAKLSDLWLGKIAADGHRSEVVHALHEKYGPVVRIAPNHISIADPNALPIVYGHGTGTLKSDFYDAFVSIHRTIFNTRDRHAHTRKRKIVSNIFSQKSVLEFEPHVRSSLNAMISKWDGMITDSEKASSGKDWKAEKGRVWFDCMTWFNYLAFDIISDLAYGKPFGMVEKGEDIAEVAIPGSKTGETKRVPAIQILNDRGEFTGSMGVLPLWLRPLVKKIPSYAKGSKAMANVAGIAVAAVNKRLQEETDRQDLLAKLQQGKDENGNPMGKEELTAEALTQLVAGSDTTSNSFGAIMYYLAKNQAAQKTLQAELDEMFGHEDEIILSYEQVKRLKYLEACINEALRLHGTIAVGLPRIVPEGGLAVNGRHFPEGSILSVPTYTIHRNKEVWGEDADEYRPERWFEQNQAAMTKCFNAFSYGPRGCVGRNLAYLELLVTTATIFRRYTFTLEDPSAPLNVCEGFLRKPLACDIGMQVRNH
ncbi:cytochrome P450 monooxygenase pc-bph [Cyathus striatus]|nr:cytochrome P450 monooxygenase pc-bph [Cyathus striatus]